MTIQEAAQSALDVQDACNLSGVARSFADVMATLVHSGTRIANQHPIATLYLLKMCELNGCDSTLNPHYGPAEDECKHIASLSLDTTTAS